MQKIRHSASLTCAGYKLSGTVEDEKGQFSFPMEREKLFYIQDAVVDSQCSEDLGR